MEYKFRGKTKEGKWVYGGYAEYDNGKSIIYQKNGISYEVLPETVGMFIGIKNKNGKDVYKEDVIKREDGIIAKVEWDNDTASFILKESDGKHWINIKSPLDRNIEIIGNIYDNSNLLN
jgi:hypothetical protein